MFDTPVYESPRQFAKRHILSERQVRQLIDQGKVPGIRTAKGFKINCGLFLEQLDSISRQTIPGGATL